MPSKSRNKGNSYERKIAQEFRDLGYTDCKTSRYESKMLDDMKVDLTNTKPYNVQLKAVEKLGILHNVLAEMPDDDNINVVFHKVSRKGEVVAMYKEDFYELIKQLNNGTVK